MALPARRPQPAGWTQRHTKGNPAVQTMTGALANAAALAGYAPSIHNTQPWRWRVSENALDLFAVHSRQLAITDPDGRLAILSCGAALHHVRTALAAEGIGFDVTRLPDPTQPGLLARISLAERTRVIGASVHQAIKQLSTGTDRFSWVFMDPPYAAGEVEPVMELLSDRLRALCDEGIRHAASDGRRTLMDRDFK